MSLTVTAPEPFRLRSGALLDVGIALVTLAGSLAVLRHGGIDVLRTGSAVSPSAELDLIGVVLAACSTVPLVAWRRFPFGVFVVTAAASVLLAGLGYPLDMAFGAAAALYLLAASRPRETPWTAATSATVGGLFITYLGATGVAHQAFPGIELVHTGLAWALAWFAGERTRLRREHVADLRKRAQRAEREAERERLLAITEERARIARDLHDSAGHAISVIAVRAGAARLRHHRDPDRSLVALEAIEEVARQTVEEIDHMVGTLRESSANGAVEAPARLSSLDTLIAHHAAAGLEVEVDVSGEPRSLGAAADQGAYRILQEALTNAARHGAASAQIRLAFGDDAVELMVTNPVLTDGGLGLPEARGAPRSGGGHGLIGMRERATLLGGSFDAGSANGAFRVLAQIPYGGHPS